MCLDNTQTGDKYFLKGGYNNYSKENKYMKNGF